MKTESSSSIIIFIIIRSCFDSRSAQVTATPEQNLNAMQPFFASPASSSPDRAELSATASSSAGRAEESATSRRSAEQPATSLHLKISSIRDVQAWLNGEQVAGCSSADAQRIREAVAVLLHPNPRK